MGTERDFAKRVAEAYATDGAAIDLGRGIVDGKLHKDATVQVPAAMLNRHGLIAGATGTGKTKTLQLLAEQLSSIGVPVFAADMKGDLAGISKPGEANDRVTTRVQDLGIEWTPEGHPVTFLSLGGLGPGVPVRATVSSFGPTLMAKVLGANETQESSLSLVFRYADENGLALLDLDDLREVLKFLTSDEGKSELKEIGGLSTATAGVLLRKIIELEDQGGDAFFGEPELEVSDLLRTEGDAGVISCLELAAVQDKPKLFSTFLMWLLAELFQELPEVGDLDKPKLVFFFDEAHLLFADASKGFLEQVAQTVRLIRSKGVGVYFITQNPIDIPDRVAGQLGNRVQHKLNAFTPRDERAVKSAADTFRPNPQIDVSSAITELKVGEALVSLLRADGSPSPVQRVLVKPPGSRVGPLTDQERATFVTTDAIGSKYDQLVDSESAHEMLAQRAEAAAQAEQAAREKAEAEAQAAREEKERIAAQRETDKLEAQRRREASRPTMTDKIVTSATRAAASSIGRQIGNQLLRGILGGLLRGR